MRSRIVQLPAGPCTSEVLRAAAGDEGEPDLVLGFLPADERLAAHLSLLAAVWPGSLRFGCEAAGQIAGGERTCHGILQLFWFEVREHGAALDVIEWSGSAPPPAGRIDALARRLSAADGALLLVDGERFPAESFLAELRAHLGAGTGGVPCVAGALPGTSAAGDGTLPGGAPAAAGTLPGGAPATAGTLPGTAPAAASVAGGAHVFFRDQVLPAACLALLFHGLDVRVEVARSWGPASPVYTVDRAEGNVLWEIDGTTATDWYRRFFTAGGALAPLPASARRFPLLVDGPKPERQGIYRAMRSFNQPPGSVTFWGSVETGDRVRLAMRQGMPAGTAEGAPAEAAILCSWEGGPAAACDQLAALQRVAGRTRDTRHAPKIPLGGLLTRAEIGPAARGDLALHNQTDVLLLLAERRS